MIGKIAFSVVAIGALVCGSAAQAQQANYNLSGSGISGSISVNYVANPTPTGTLGTSPNTVDPVGSYMIHDISGTFSDSTIGLSAAAITGIVLSQPAHPEPTNLLAPHSFGFYPVAAGVQGPPNTPPAPGFSYDNLFYPGGSPQTASDYPFSGGVLDIYGIVFTLANGDAVNLWSNGATPGAGLNYGVGVTDGKTVLDYAQPVWLTAVPEPGSWAMMLLGFGGIGFAIRRRKPSALHEVAAQA